MRTEITVFVGGFGHCSLASRPSSVTVSPMSMTDNVSLCEYVYDLSPVICCVGIVNIQLPSIVRLDLD